MKPCSPEAASLSTRRTARSCSIENSTSRSVLLLTLPDLTSLSLTSLTALQSSVGLSDSKDDAILNRLAINAEDRGDVKATFRAFCGSSRSGPRPHLGLLRSKPGSSALVHPARQPRQRIIGNPPWLAYRFMPDHMQKLYRALSEERGLWAGGKVSTHQDLSDLFVVRSVEQYLRKGGRFGFVMPAAALSRRQFEGFRTGSYDALGVQTRLEFGTPWDLRGVSPDIFPVPAAVVFGERAGQRRELPQEARRYSGRIAPRATRWGEAQKRTLCRPT